MSAKNKKIPHRVKHIGIVSDAAELGVTQSHLWRVLQGLRESPPLLRRYRELQKRKGKAAK